jgi:hypothetical protein
MNRVQARNRWGAINWAAIADPAAGATEAEKPLAWPGAKQWLQRIVIPQELLNAPGYHWVYGDFGKRPVRSLDNVNADMVGPLTRALLNIAREPALVCQLHSLNGVWNIRASRSANKGQFKKSFHAWGAAIDINAGENAYRRDPNMSRDFVRAFTSEGLTS